MKTQRGTGGMLVKAEDVNAYLKDAAAGDSSAKDFRTWNATALCAVALAVPHGRRPRAAPAPGSCVPRSRRSCCCSATRPPCAAPPTSTRVIDCFNADQTIAAALAEHTEPQPGEPIEAPAIDERVRRAVLDLIAG